MARPLGAGTLDRVEDALAGDGFPQIPRLPRAILPGELYAPTAGPSPRDRLADVVVVISAAAPGAFALVDVWSSRDIALDVVDLCLGSAACALLWLRRSRPFAVAVFAVTASAFLAMSLGAALIAIFTGALRLHLRRLVIVTMLALTASTVFPLVNPETVPLLRMRFPGFMFTAIALGWGLFARARQALIVSLREHAAHLSSERDVGITRAREAERHRIAREMHDALGHRLSLLSVHAGALEYRPDAPREEIAQAASVVRASAAAALEELRGVIDVLRDGESATAPPQPVLTALPDLFDQWRAAGMEIRARIGTGAALAPGVERAAVRVVQEGLTNANRHAPGAPVDLTLECLDGGFTLEMRNGRADRPPGRRPEGSGTGLVGLAERLALLGGTLEQGATSGGGFLLRATVPPR